MPDRQSLADLQEAASEKPDIAHLILAVLSPFPYGLTTREVIELTGMTSYNTSGKLSKLAACGVIEKITMAGHYRPRWRVKPAAPISNSDNVQSCRPRLNR
jgi:DNA-binding IclR family transcriptional regulator